MPACLRMSVKRTGMEESDFLVFCVGREFWGSAGEKRKPSARGIVKRRELAREVIGCDRRAKVRFAEIVGARERAEVAWWQRKFAARWRGPARCDSCRIHLRSGCL